MTQGEKMVWAAVFSQTYADHVKAFRVDMHTAKSFDEQREDWRTQGSALAAEESHKAVIAMRSVDTDSVGADVMLTLSDMLS